MPRRSSAVVVVLGITLTGCSQGALLPQGPQAARLADLLWLMVGLASLVFVVVVVSAVVAVVRGADDDLEEQRRGRGEQRDEAGDRTIERWMVVGGGIALPVVILGGLMAVNVSAIASGPADGELRIDVVAHQYWWEIGYDGFETANEIHVPAGTEFELVVTARDVIHSVWVPELGGKIDAVPGRETRLVLEADEPGRYVGRCAEYCGLQHTWMLFEVVAHTPEEFERWRQREAADATEPSDELALEGRAVFRDNACVGCHTIRGVAEEGDAGPDLTHLASREQLGAGVVDNTEGRLREWVVNAQSLKPGVGMPPQELDEQELDALLAYLESLE